jgi:hypothetical protein
VLPAVQIKNPEHDIYRWEDVKSYLGAEELASKI